MMNKEDFTFIVPAAGKSTRFKTKKSKIFYKYRNKFLLFNTTSIEKVENILQAFKFNLEKIFEE